ncbi:glycosyltransferase family 4 protein [Plantactinospora veratri]|uniref:Glycosyltransferase family 4 protein n=1 Tax=Plantactinospora veratri TaxID=1436122 RepID=A0ABU7SFA1_9ACTN
MKVIVSTESRFVRTPDGAVWTHDGPTRRFFARYLSSFDQVGVLARVAEVTAPPDDARRVDGDGISVCPVPYYVGPRQYLRRRAAILRAVRQAAASADAVIVRAPSPIGTLLVSARRRIGSPYAIEVVGDPFDVFAPGVVEHPLRPLLRRRYVAAMRQHCATATGVAYVTEAYLQARYPAAPGAVTASYSSVDLPAEAYVPAPRGVDRCRQARTLISVGSLEQMYKGIDTLIRALPPLAAAGPPVRLVHLGDGRYRPRLERLATDLGVRRQVHFTGTISAATEVRRQLDAADLFVMPSRTEGLPKALIEAMARGLPAVATSVGGIPELLPPEDLVAADDVAGLARLIGAHLTRPDRMSIASARNLARSRAYLDEELTRRRDGFYREVRDAVDLAASGGR